MQCMCIQYYKVLKVCAKDCKCFLCRKALQASTIIIEMTVLGALEEVGVGREGERKQRRKRVMRKRKRRRE